jgi:hypothetical protein
VLPLAVLLPFLRGRTQPVDVALKIRVQASTDGGLGAPWAFRALACDEYAKLSPPDWSCDHDHSTAYQAFECGKLWLVARGSRQKTA